MEAWRILSRRSRCKQCSAICASSRHRRASPCSSNVSDNSRRAALNDITDAWELHINLAESKLDDAHYVVDVAKHRLLTRIQSVERVRATYVNETDWPLVFHIQTVRAFVVRKGGCTCRFAITPCQPFNSRSGVAMSEMPPANRRFS